MVIPSMYWKITFVSLCMYWEVTNITWDIEFQHRALEWTFSEPLPADLAANYKSRPDVRYVQFWFEVTSSVGERPDTVALVITSCIILCPLTLRTFSHLNQQTLIHTTVTEVFSLVPPVTLASAYAQLQTAGHATVSLEIGSGLSTLGSFCSKFLSRCLLIPNNNSGRNPIAPPL